MWCNIKQGKICITVMLLHICTLGVNNTNAMCPNKKCLDKNVRKYYLGLKRLVSFYGSVSFSLRKYFKLNYSISLNDNKKDLQSLSIHSWCKDIKSPSTNNFDKKNWNFTISSIVIQYFCYFSSLISTIFVWALFWDTLYILFYY